MKSAIPSYTDEGTKGRCHVIFQRIYFLRFQAFSHGLCTLLCPQKAPYDIVIQRNTLTTSSGDRSLNITGTLGQCRRSCKNSAKGWWLEDLTLELTVGCWADESTSLHLGFFLSFLFLAVLRHCYTQAFLLTSGDYSLVAVCGLLILVVSRVAKHGL